MNKWLYKNIQWLYCIFVEFRLSWYIHTIQLKKAECVINEHMDW